MKDLTDLEICIKIAEIEGIKLDTYYAGTDVEYVTPSGSVKPYNPLTDDGLCFQLMIKHKVEIEFDSDLNFVCACNFSWVSNVNPRKAICLAIIEANS